MTAMSEFVSYRHYADSKKPLLTAFSHTGVLMT